MNPVGMVGQAARLLDDQGKSLLGLAFVWYLEPTLALDRSDHGIARSAACIRAWQEAWEAVIEGFPQRLRQLEDTVGASEELEDLDEDEPDWPVLHRYDYLVALLHSIRVLTSRRTTPTTTWLRP